MDKTKDMKQNISFTDAFLKTKLKEKYVLDQLRAYNKGIAVDWHDLTKLFLNEFVDYIRNEISQNSARTYCAHIKSVMNRYSQAIRLPYDDFAKILSLQQGGVMNLYLTLDEIQLLLNCKPRTETEHTIRNQFVLSCLTGMRYSDVVNLDKNNIVNSEIIYVSQKTNKVVHTVSCPVTEYLISEKMNYKYPHKTFNEVIKQVCENAGINSEVKIVWGGQTETGQKCKFISSHDARRSFATNNYAATKDLVLVSKLMGHKDTKTTEGYICNHQVDTTKVQAMLGKLSVAS